ncbi:MAG: hypothetical protein ACJ78Q_05915 [Chloroflexia bacterium]
MNQHPAASLPIENLASDLGRAHRLLSLALVTLVCGVAVGVTWDRAWHARHVFETFYSPPHLFVYSVVALAALMVASMVLRPGIRSWFGQELSLPPVPFSVPGSMIILAGGFFTLALAGLLDNLWHTSFGLDETSWSEPHAMISWGLLVVCLGFAACRLALRPYRPLRWYTVLMLGYLVLAVSAAPFMGPLYHNNTPDSVRAVAAIPTLVAQPAAQHTFAIYLQWNLDRTNLLLIPLGALWAGAVLAFVRGLDRRAWVFLTVVSLWSLVALLGDRATARRLDQFVPTSHDPASWLPLPLLPAAIAIVMLIRARVPERWAWPATGLLFGLLTTLTWGTFPLGYLAIAAAAPAMAAGAPLGRQVYRALERPTVWGIRALLLAGVTVPLLVGAIDLYVRANTPWR